MEITIRELKDIVILDMEGRIDINSAVFVEVVGQCIRDGWKNFLCNFEEVEFIDYMGVSALVIAYKEVVNNQGMMKFIHVPLCVRNILSVTGIDKVIEIYPGEEAGVNSFKEGKVTEGIGMMPLRRRFKRLPLDIKIELKSKIKQNSVCVNAEILNLSGIGALIFGCAKFKLGDEITLKLKLSPDKEEIEIEAKVVWLPDKQIQPHFYPGMGVEFINIPGPLQEKIIEFVERNASSLTTD